MRRIPSHDNRYPVNYRSIKGTKDILPSETPLWQFVEQTIREVFRQFNYKEIRTPVFETTSLFARSIGELTDIVGKEMYTFQDRSGDSITLRPEGTASAIRAYIQNNLGEALPLSKVYYIGPMFRQERPQAGRLRQFHQFGAEAIGSPTAETDVEIIAMTIEIYKRLGITNYSLQINSVGDEECRPKYKEILNAELQKIAGQLSTESQKRIDQNPMRVLDSKNENDQKLTAGMPLITDYLNEECATHFAKVKSLLTAYGIPYTVNGRLVRGLDYYTKTAFEITSTELGSQDALAGGGRYDLLVKELGGKQTPSVGFAAGMERLLMILEKKGFQPPQQRPTVFIAAADDAAREWVLTTTMKLRSQGIASECDLLARSLKSQMKEADRQQAEFSLVVGATELESGKALLKHLSDHSQQNIVLEAIAEFFKH
ncbi:MAG: histidine--tRNA ligase [Bacteroidetes bacterium]|nr:histidine--tRNA ligase [Bacteroidota bacterium]